MRVLVVGRGGREHALIWKLAQSPVITRLYCAPGNAGTGMRAENVPINTADITGLVGFAKNAGIDYTVVGPELPLSLGIVDVFEKEGLFIFGPTRRAAALETSKVHAKRLMAAHNIPTAPFWVFYDADEADRFIDNIEPPVVVKADGLAEGKGAFVCDTRREAHEAVRRIMRLRQFGGAGNMILIETFLQGDEVSFLALTDGAHVLPLVACQDFKRALDDDKGLNTGGMAAYSPVPFWTDALEERVVRDIIEPTLCALANQGRPYRGVIYAGLMIVKGEPYVLEFNARFGDPEMQPLVVRLANDLLPLLMATTDGTLSQKKAWFSNEAAACLVMTSGGYPEAYETSKLIEGVQAASQWDGTELFHAGTRWDEHNRLVTDGGRVLGVTALAPDLGTAISKAYHVASGIKWEGVHYRRDIRRRALSYGA